MMGMVHDLVFLRVFFCPQAVERDDGDVGVMPGAEDVIVVRPAVAAHLPPGK